MFSSRAVPVRASLGAVPIGQSLDRVRRDLDLVPATLAPDVEPQMRPRRAAERRRPAGLQFSRSPHYLGMMAWENLTDEERAELLRELRGLIAADPYPLSPRIQRLKATLAKLDPASFPAPRPAPKPVTPSKPYVPRLAKRKARSRR